MRVWSFLFISIAVSSAFIACGSTSSRTPVSQFDGGTPDSTTPQDSGTSDTGMIMMIGDGFVPPLPEACVPKTCAEQGFECGPNADGCGSLLECGTCEAGMTCGGGGFSKCGGGAPSDAAMDGCVPQTCASQGYTCGTNSDGCGGTLQCGTCDAGFCGGGGFSVCGGEVDAEGCPAKTCAEQGINCGAAGDGCGNTLSCGTCTFPEFCGGGGFGKCGGMLVQQPDACVPRTCAEQGFNCGPTGDGCGNLIASCGTCTNPQFCGALSPGQCGGVVEGGVVCHPQTCASQGISCGPAGDGCGNVLDCGVCQSPQTCGGGGTLYQCGAPATVQPVTPSTCDGGPLCASLPNCSAGLTSVTGKVFAASSPFLTAMAGSGLQSGTPDPVPNVTVYVPNGGPPPAYGVSPVPGGSVCGCGGTDLVNPISQTVTAADGSFELKNVPVMANMPLVIQLGRWRREILIPQTTACVNTAVPDGTITMPSKQIDTTAVSSNIPLTAISTGNTDALECVLLKMGIAQSEFQLPQTNGMPSSSGRVQLYVGNGAIIAGVPNPPQEAALTTSPAALSSYDQVLFPCWEDNPVVMLDGGGTQLGGPNFKTVQEQQNLLNYTNSGGKMFTTHYSYAWLNNDPGNVNAFSQTAQWALNTQEQTSVTGTIDFPSSIPSDPRTTFAAWMNFVLAGSQFNLTKVRQDFTGVNAPTIEWISTLDNMSGTSIHGFPLLFTFDTPYNAAQTCGRVTFSDFHVTSSANTTGVPFPTECTPGAMSFQEHALEYLIWNLDSCAAPVCTPKTCLEQNIFCGAAGDGCGNQLNCGVCNPPQTCGGSGQNGVCGAPPPPGRCTPLTCAQQNLACGPAGDGCGNEIAGGCGTCLPPNTCGGGGQNGLCGSAAEGGICIPETCAALGYTCGSASDGCGNLIPCGVCTAPDTCGGGGTPFQCGAPPDGGICTPKTCAPNQCGPAGDGCGNMIMCPTCDGGTCGGGGPSMCGTSLDACVPESCMQQNISCGPTGDGCGGLLECGNCISPQTCGGGGTPGKCGGNGGGNN